MLRRLGTMTAVVAVLLTGCSTGGNAAPPTASSSPTASPSASPTPSPTPSPTAAPTPSVLPGFALAPLGKFAAPVWVGPAPGVANRLYLVQKQGLVLELDAEGHQLGVLLDIRKLVTRGQEQGLLSMAFDPAYQVNHRLYVDYTNQHGDPQVVAYTVVNGQAIHPQVLLTVFQPYPNHNGGMLLFDRTGMLLVGMGDGGNAGDPQNRAQDLYSDLGKILRIDPRTGAGAPGNPFPENQRVWAFGLRNPWRFAFDTNGDLYVGDVGQNKFEELDVVPPALQRGANYGWSVFEGDERFKDDKELTPGGHVIVPALTYPHSDGSCSITAGEIYRGSAFPGLRGRFVYGDFCLGELNVVRRTRTGVSPPDDLGVKAEELQGFGHDTRGELLVLTIDTLYRLVPGA